MIEYKRVAVALTMILIAASIVLMASLSNLTRVGVKGEIEVLRVEVNRGENRLLVYVKNVGNVTVVSEKAYLTLPSGLEVTGLVEAVEIRPGEVKPVAVDFSFYTTIRFNEEGEYVLKLCCSNNAVGEAKFKV